MKTVVSHQHRYGQHYHKVREIADSGALGRIHTVYAHAVGWATHMLSHMVDLARWYEKRLERGHKEGLVPRAELLRARYKALTLEIDLLRTRRAIGGKEGK